MKLNEWGDSIQQMKAGRRNKIVVTCLLLGVAVSLVYFRGRISAFAPRHNMISFVTLELGHLPFEEPQLLRNLERNPGFYTFSAALFGVTGISKAESLYLPLLLVPTTVVLYGLLYRFSTTGRLGDSETHLFVAVVVAGYLVSGTDGSDKLFLGLHGVGIVLVYGAVLLLVTYVRSPHHPRRYLAVGLPIILALSLIDYNRIALMLLTLGAVGLLGLVASVTRVAIRGEARLWRATVAARFGFVLFVVAAVTILFVHTLLPQVLPYLSQTLTSSSTALGTFLTTFFSSGASSPVADLFVEVPDAATYISVLRYLTIFGVLAWFSVSVGRNALDARSVSGSEFVILAYTAGSALMALVRMLIGHTAFLIYAFRPGLFATASLFGASRRPARRVGSRTKTVVVGVAVLLLALSVLYFPVHYQHGVVNDNSQDFERTRSPADWHQQHVSGPVRTDELTSNLFRLHTMDEGDYFQASGGQLRLLLDRGGASESVHLVLNENLARVPIGSWSSLVPWDRSMAAIQSNTRVSKVYTAGDVTSYYHPR